MHRIQGTHNDSVGLLLSKYFLRNTGREVHPPYSAIGWVKDGNVVGQAIFVDYTGSNLEVHLYAPGCMNKKTIKDVFNYVFNVSRCNRLTAKPYCTNEKLLQLLPRLGFVYEGVLKNYYGTRENPIDGVSYYLDLDHAAKWIK